MAETDQAHLTTLTVDLLSAYVANNTVEHGDLSQLIQSTHAALKAIDSPEPSAPPEPEFKPAVSVRKSLGSRTHIISMIDGKPYQTLKRHLSKHGLTPEAYRVRYGLPVDYPMVAPAYSESRRAIAERLGLGRRVTGAQSKAQTAPEAPVSPPAAKAVATKAAKAAPKTSKPAPAAAKAATGKVETKAEAAPAKPVRKPRAAPVPAPAQTAEAKPTASKSRGREATSASTPEPAAKPVPRKRVAKDSGSNG